MRLYSFKYGRATITAVHLAIATTLSSACGASAPAQTETPQAASLLADLEGAPEWARGDCAASNEKLLCGVGSVSGMSNISLARSAAQGRARTEIARTLQVKVAALLKDYQSSITGSAEKKAWNEQKIQDTSKQVADQSLSGSRMKDSWISKTGVFYALVVIDGSAVKQAINEMKELSAEERRAITAHADAAFDELDAATAQKPVQRSAQEGHASAE